MEVVCPHCESRYTLERSLLDQRMRCPSPSCREVFVVAEAEPEGAPIFMDEDVPPKVPAKTHVSDLVPVLDVEPELEPEATRPITPAKAARTKPARAVPKPSAEAPTGPTEVVWGAGGAGPIAPPLAEPTRLGDTEPAEAQILDENDPLLRRRRRRGLPLGILLGLVAFIVLLVGAIGIRLVQQELRKEAVLAEEAAEEFKKSNYPAAATAFGQLVSDYPKSDEFARYEFMGELSNLHATIGGSAKDNPQTGISAYNDFIKKRGDDPFAKPDETGFGYDVFEAGRKLTDALVDHCKDRLKKFQGKRDKPEELPAIEQVLADGRLLLPIIEKYRLKDVQPLDAARKAFDDIGVETEREKFRLAVLAPFRRIGDDPSDDKIAAFLAALRRSGFEQDDEAVRILEDAKLKLRKLIATVADVRPADPVPKENAPSLLFIAPPAGEKPPPPAAPNPDAVPETVFAVARGILYALDVEFGTLLWATRVGTPVPGSASDDVPLRVNLGDGGTELAIIPNDIGGKPGLTARVVRTGEALWHQSLEAAPAGRPVLVGRRLYVPLRDELGTVVEIESATGQRLAKITFRQRLGAGAVVQPGTNLIYVPAEGRRVFILDAAPTDADGTREPMRCVKVLNTDHPDQSMRVAPVISGPAGEQSAPRFLVLAQTDGTYGSKLRSFPIEPPAKPKAGEPPPEVAPPMAGTVALKGHIRLPMIADGERIALLTDAGLFSLLGTNLPGNQDPGLFEIPSSALTADAKKPMPSSIVHADEDEFWVLTRGNLVRLRMTLNPIAGMQVAPSGLVRPAGVPLHRSQINAKRDTVFAVVRSEESNGIRAIALDPRDGRIRWQRKLGAVPPTSPIIQRDGGVILVDEDGGAYALPIDAAAVADIGTRPIQPSWVASPPSALTAETPRVAADAAGVWIVIPEKNDKAKQVRFQHVVAGKLTSETVLAMPDRPAGDPVVVGGSVAVPLADGFVYRLDVANNKLVAGPQWRGEGVGPDAVCFLNSAGSEEFVGSDGGKRIYRWRWPTTGDWKMVAGPWEIRDKVAFAPVVLNLGETTRRLVVADQSGSVWLYDSDRVGESLRRWRGTPEGKIPVGKPQGGFTQLVIEDKPRLVYGLTGGALVALNPTEAEPAWVYKPGADAADWLGTTASGAQLVATDVAGNVTIINGQKGTVVGTTKTPLADLYPRAMAIPFGPDRLLYFGWDGSAVFLPMPAGK
ncbi:MAG: PQQ-binding-like beta-propeller repeat protein [Gemmataceae bacterium]